MLLGDGTDRVRLEKLAINAVKNEKIIFKGSISNDLLPLYYKRCDVFVHLFPGIVFLEAMYYEKPLIGANDLPTSEIIEDGKTGFLCDPKNSNLVVKTLIKLLQDNNLQQLMGLAGKTKYEKEFSFDVFKKKLEMILCT